MDMPRNVIASVVICCVLLAGCANERLVRRVQAYHLAHTSGDLAAESAALSPDARTWYESRSGAGEPLRPGRTGRYAHWDTFFHSRSTFSDWIVCGREVTATVHETNDFYRLLDWKPNPYQMTWWFDDRDRITGVMVRSLPGKETSRMEEFRAWAAVHDPTEIEYLMPKGKLDPTGDRPERWKALLVRWREAAGLPY
jgi:outer membrane murein-binding lipoprotein Lpp